MGDKQTGEQGHPRVDPEHDTSGKPFDKLAGYSGQDYAIGKEEAVGRERPSGHPLVGDPDVVDLPTPDPEGRDIPPEDGHRAWFDPKTGEVHGSGSGAGEEFDD